MKKKHAKHVIEFNWTKRYAGYATSSNITMLDHNLRASIQAPVLVSLQYTVGTSGDLPRPLRCTTGWWKAGSIQIQIPCESCRNLSKSVKFSLLSPVFAQEGESVPLAIVSWAGCDMQESKTSVQKSRHKLDNYTYIAICKQAEPSAWTIANTLTLQNHTAECANSPPTSSLLHLWWLCVILGLCTFLAHATLFVVPVSVAASLKWLLPRLKFKGALGWYREWRVLTYAWGWSRAVAIGTICTYFPVLHDRSKCLSKKWIGLRNKTCFLLKEVMLSKSPGIPSPLGRSQVGVHDIDPCFESSLIWSASTGLLEACTIPRLSWVPALTSCALRRTSVPQSRSARLLWRSVLQNDTLPWQIQR